MASEEILTPQQHRIRKSQIYLFTTPEGTEKQVKTIEEQGEKQRKATEE